MMGFMTANTKLSVSERKQLENVKANRMLVTFGLTGAGLLILSLISRLGLYTTIGLSTLERILGLCLVGLGVVGVVAGLLWAKSDAKKGISLALKLFNGLTLSAIAITVLLCSLSVLVFYDFGIRLSYILIVLVAGLSLIRLMFHHEFTISATILGFGAFLFYAMHRLQASLLIIKLIPFAWFVAGLGLVSVLLLLVLWRQKGRLFGVTLLPRSFHYLPASMAALALFLAPVACLLVTMSYLLYIALGFFAVLLAYGVYYTLRLI